MNLVDDIEEPGVYVGFTLTAADAERARALAESMRLDIPDALVELIRRTVPARNGRGFQAICDNCGLPFTSFHRPKAGIKHYCNLPDCKREAAADRARRYRQRKTKEQRA